MQQEKEDYKIPYHFLHVQEILISILKQLCLKFDTIMFTRRTEQIVFSVLTQTQIISCGFNKIILPNSINPYMEYEQIVLVLTLSGEQDYQQVSQFSKNIDKVSILNLGICTQQSKSLLKKIQFKDKNSIRGFKQQNVDFFSYLHNTYILSTRKQLKSKQKMNKKNKKNISAISDTIAIDRLCSFLFSYQNFSQFQFYIPKNNEPITKIIKQTIQSKLAILNKYAYKGLTKNQGMSSVRTRVIVLQRTEYLSPFILSLYYGPLAQQLNIVNNCKFVSIHSTIYNQLYHLDILKAGQLLGNIAQQLSTNKQKKINSINLNETKKILQKAYNPNLSKQQLKFHQTLLQQINKFMEKNCDLLALQQSIANKINQQGQQMKGGSVVKQVHAWIEKNPEKYERYLGLIMEAFAVNSFWWYQKNQLLAGISDNEDKEGIQKYIKKCKQKYKLNSLKQKAPKKDEDGSQLRQKCFRHDPPILKQYLDIQQEIKQKKITTCQVLKINSAEIQKIGKKTRTIIYINGIIGYNQLAMLLPIINPEVDIVCRDILNTKQWIQYQLFQ